MCVVCGIKFVTGAHPGNILDESKIVTQKVLKVSQAKKKQLNVRSEMISEPNPGSKSC